MYLFAWLVGVCVLLVAVLQIVRVAAASANFANSLPGISNASAK